METRFPSRILYNYWDCGDIVGKLKKEKVVLRIEPQTLDLTTRITPAPLDDIVMISRENIWR